MFINVSEIVGNIMKNMMNCSWEPPVLNSAHPKRPYVWSQRENQVQKTSSLLKLLLIPVRRLLHSISTRIVKEILFFHKPKKGHNVRDEKHDTLQQSQWIGQCSGGPEQSDAKIQTKMLQRFTKHRRKLSLIANISNVLSAL